jgi:hypothetical protein
LNSSERINVDVKPGDICWGIQRMHGRKDMAIRSSAVQKGNIVKENVPTENIDDYTLNVHCP